jgi:putative tricarboxylic transport membrane protein
LGETTLGGALWILLSLVVAAECVRLGLGSLGRPGPGFVAFGAALLVAVQGALLVISGLRGAAPRIADQQGGRWLAPLATMASLVAYAVSMPLLGFDLASFLFIGGLLFASAPRRLLQAIAMAAVAVVASHLLFITLLKVRMPMGILGTG